MTPPEWFRWAMVTIGGFGVAAALLFVVGFLLPPNSSKYRRRDLIVLDQWLLFAAGGLASGIYAARWALDPPETWGGPVYGLAVLVVLGLVDAAFALRLWTWRGTSHNLVHKVTGTAARRPTAPARRARDTV